MLQKHNMFPTVNDEEIKTLAKKMASDQMKQRIYGVKMVEALFASPGTLAFSIQQWFPDTSITYTDTLLLCKGLFYALWQQDKLLLQESVVEKIVNILRLSQPLKRPYLISAMFETIAREWDRLDTFRLDKFMMLLRDFFVMALRTSRCEEDFTLFTAYVFEKILNDDANQCLGLRAFFTRVVYEEFRKQKVPSALVLEFFSSSVDVMVRLPRYSPALESIMNLSSNLIRILGIRKIDKKSCVDMSKRLLNLATECPSYRKTLTSLSKSLIRISKKAKLNTVEVKKLPTSKKKLTTKMPKKANTGEQTSCDAQMEVDELEPQPEKPREYANASLDLEASEEKGDAQVCPRRVSFGKIFRKKVVLRRPSLPMASPSGPVRGILRKSLS